MNEIVKLYEVSKKLFDLVEKPVVSEERDTYIESLVALVEERGIVLNAIHREPSDQEKLLLQQIASMQQQMEPKLQSELLAIKRDINNLKKRKETGQKYENPYYYAPIDGAFIDKKN
ncbi:hypothetical protein ACERII_16620 [Evansella sp. AB-rgal1]|uniref:hypothetical protein n=1 Tax=Evansella sp. AB-rgal1 TaxID=3242696 RepID=UPI00359E872E